ncbi:ADP,ATP carrier protein 1, partial [Dictyocoela roeselum]
VGVSVKNKNILPKSSTGDYKSEGAFRIDMEGQCTIENVAKLSKESETFAGNNTCIFGILCIAPSELGKLCLISLIVGIIIFVYTLSKSIKDALVIEMQTIGVWYMKIVVMPAVVLMVIPAIQSLYYYYDSVAIMKYTFSSFGFYFIIYGVFIFPNRSLIEPISYINLDRFDGSGFNKGGNVLNGLVVIAVRWTVSLHIVTTELWGTVVLSVIFMSFVNDICTIEQFTRFLPVITVFANAGCFASLFFTWWYIKLDSTLSLRLKIDIISVTFISFGALSFVIVPLISHLIRYCHDKPYAMDYTIDQKENKDELEGEKADTNSSIIEENTNMPVNEENTNMPVNEDNTNMPVNEENTNMPVNEENIGIWCFFKKMVVSRFSIAMCLSSAFYNIFLIIFKEYHQATMAAYAQENNADIIMHVLKEQWKKQFTIAVSVTFILLFPIHRLIETLGWLPMALITPIFSFVAVFIISMISFMITSKSKEFCIDILTPFGEKAYDLFPPLTTETEQWISMQFFCAFLVMKQGPYDMAKDIIGRRIDKKYRTKLKS